MLQRVVARSKEGRTHDNHIPSRCLAALSIGESTERLRANKTSVTDRTSHTRNRARVDPSRAQHRPSTSRYAEFSRAPAHPPAAVDTTQRRQDARSYWHSPTKTLPTSMSADAPSLVSLPGTTSPPTSLCSTTYPIASSASPTLRTPPPCLHTGRMKARGPIGLADMFRVASAMGSVEFAVLLAMAGGGHATMGFGTLQFSSAGTVLPGVHTDSANTVSSIVESTALRHAEQLRESIARSGIRRVRPTNRAPRTSLAPGAPQVPDALSHSATSQNRPTVNDGTRHTPDIRESVRSDLDAIPSTPLDLPSRVRSRAASRTARVARPPPSTAPATTSQTANENRPLVRGILL